MLDNKPKNTSFLAASDEEAALVKVRKTIFKYLAHFYLFILFIGLGLTVAYLYLKYTNPVYRASATLLLIKDDKASGYDKDIIDAMVSGKPKVNVQDEIELIRSRYLLNKVVEKNNLDVAMWVHGRIRTTELSDPYPFTVARLDSLTDTTANMAYSVTFVSNDKFTVNKLPGKTFSYNEPFVVDRHFFKLLPNLPVRPELNMLYDVSLYNTQTAASIIAGGLKITPKSNLSRVVELNYTGTNTTKVANVLQLVMEEYLQLGVDEKKMVQKKTLAFINERLSVLSGELGSVEGQKQDFRKTQNVIDVSSQSQQFLTEASSTVKDLSQLLVKKQMINYLVDYLNNKDNLFNLTPTNLGIEDPVLLSLSQSYNSLILERQKELTINTSISPIIKNLDAAIEKTRLSLLENLKSVRSNNDLLIAQLTSEKNRVQSEISQLPGKERQYTGILRQETIKNNLFSFLLQKREETEIALAGASTEAKILNSSLVSPAPISPNRRTIWLVALLVGTAIPLLIIWIKDLLNNKVNTRADITSAVEAPLLGEIGNNRDEDPIVVKPASRKLIGEQFRNIRSNINFLVPGKKNFVMLVTSTNPGEGKSFSSINLAATYAIAGKRTVVVEMDLRKPKLSKYVQVQGKGGVTDYLVGKNDLKELIRPVPKYENLFLMPAGSIPPNPAELMMGERMKSLLAELKEQFDVILLDCPPVGIVSDAQILAPYVDLSVYLVRQRVTLRSQLQFINELQQSNRLSNMGIIVNDVKVSGYNGYYGYGQGSYGYGYGISKNGHKNGDGYFETDEKKKSWFGKFKV